jgi:class 3 adenylate cyclase
MSDGQIPFESERAWRLNLVRSGNVTIRADRSMPDLYRTRFQGRPAEVLQQGDTVTIEYPRGVLFFDRRRQASLVLLNPSVPWRIEVRGSAAKLTADLSAIALLGFEILDGGAREVFLFLPPPSGEVPIRIAGGATELGIHRPTGVPLRFRVAGGASGLALDDQRFRAVGGETLWQSQDYEGASDRYDILILKGASKVTVDTLDVGGVVPRRSGRLLATVLFTDIVGSTDRARAVGDRRWRELLDRHDAAAMRLVEQEKGTLVKTTGDGILAVFEEPGAAVRCARGLREELEGMGIPIRAGLHTGEVEYRGEDVGGIAVHIGARIMDAAGPREILVSRTIRDLVVGSDLELEDRGVHALKGVGDDWQLFAVS